MTSSTYIYIYIYIYIFKLSIDFAFVAPIDIKFIHVNASSLVVKFVESDQTDVDFYAAAVKGGSDDQTCEVNRTAFLTECEITHLQPATFYTIQGRSCSFNKNCSRPIEKSLWNAPPGKSPL